MSASLDWPSFLCQKKLSFSGLASDSLVAIRQQIRRQHGPQGQDETMWSLDLPPLGPKDAILVTTKRYLHLPHLQKIMPFKLVSFSWINFGIKSYTQNEDPSTILFLGHCESPLKARFRKKHDWHPGESSWGGRSKAPPAKKIWGNESESFPWMEKQGSCHMKIPINSETPTVDWTTVDTFRTWKFQGSCASTQKTKTVNFTANPTATQQQKPRSQEKMQSSWYELEPPSTTKKNNQFSHHFYHGKVSNDPHLSKN